jgi:hypothetical protein
VNDLAVPAKLKGGGPQLGNPKDAQSRECMSTTALTRLQQLGRTTVIRQLVGADREKLASTGADRRRFRFNVLAGEVGLDAVGALERFPSKGVSGDV